MSIQKEFPHKDAPNETKANTPRYIVPLNQVKETVAAVHKNEISPQLYSHDVMLKGQIADTHNNAILL